MNNDEITFLLIKMNHRNIYSAHHPPIRSSITSRQILEYADIIDENQSLKLRLSKYEEMNEYIEALINKNNSL